MKMNQGETSLDGYGTQKRHYGKCGVTRIGDVYLLRSYETLFAAYYDGRIVLTSEHKWTRTTGVHMRAFAIMLGLPPGRVSKRKFGRSIRYCLLEGATGEAAAYEIRRFITKGDAA